MSKEKKTRHFHAGKLRKNIDGCEFVEVAESNGVLFVSDDGRFVSRNGKWIPKVGNRARDGYLHVYLNGHGRNAARIVWEIFMSEIPDDKEIDHINTVRSDNRLSNLRLVTHRDNLLNPITRPRRRIACAANGKKGALAQDRGELLKNLSIGSVARRRPVIAIRGCDAPVRFESARQAADMLGLTCQAICHALKGRIRSCGGYVFKYEEGL